MESHDLTYRRCASCMPAEVMKPLSWLLTVAKPVVLFMEPLLFSLL